MPKQKLNVKPLAIKCKVIREIEKGLSNKDASLRYGEPKNTIATWVKNKEKYSIQNSWYSQNQEVTEK